MKKFSSVVFTTLMCMFFSSTAVSAASTIIENTTDIRLEGDVIVAYYNRNGAFIHAEIENNVEIIKNGTYEVQLNNNEYSNAASAKVMYVDSTENLIPLIAAEKNNLITYNQRFVVVDRVEQGINADGDKCDKLYVYNSDSKDSEVIFADCVDMFYGKLQKGDVIIYTANNDGVIENYDDVIVLFSVGDEYTNYATEVSSDKWDTIVNNIYDDSCNKDTELVFGPVIDKSQFGITIGNVYELDGKIVTATDDVDNMKIMDLDYSEDMAVYVCDFSKETEKRVFVGKKQDIQKTMVSKRDMLEDSYGDRTIINWSDSATPNGVYALARVYDYEVKDIFIIIPEEYL